MNTGASAWSTSCSTGARWACAGDLTELTPSSLAESCATTDAPTMSAAYAAPGNTPPCTWSVTACLLGATLDMVMSASSRLISPIRPSGRIDEWADRRPADAASPPPAPGLVGSIPDCSATAVTSGDPKGVCPAAGASTVVEAAPTWLVAPNGSCPGNPGGATNTALGSPSCVAP